MNLNRYKVSGSRSTWICLFLGAISSLCGCGASTSKTHQESRQSESTNPYKAIKHIVVLDKVPPTTVRVLLGDTEVGRADFPEEILGYETQIQVSESLEDRWGSVDVSVVALTPDGWTKIIQASGPPKHRPASPDCVYYEIEARKITACTIWVDNRDNPGVTLACGEIVREIPADSSVKLRFPAPSMRTALKIDGQTMNTIDAADGQKCYVLDVSGKHAYAVRTVHYGGSDVQGLVNDGTLKLSAAPMVLKGNHLYELSRIDIFLNQAPESVQGSQHDLQSRTVLTDYVPESESK